MVFLVVAEALIPGNTLPGPLYMWRAFRRSLGRARRYSEIARIILRYGLGAYLRGGRRAELRTSEGRSALADIGESRASGHLRSRCLAAFQQPHQGTESPRPGFRRSGGLQSPPDGIKTRLAQCAK